MHKTVNYFKHISEMMIDIASTIASTFRVAEFTVAEVAAERVNANCIFSTPAVVRSTFIDIWIHSEYCAITRLVSKITSSRRHAETNLIL